MNALEERIAVAAQQLSRGLIQAERRIVFAESCTAGLVIASLGAIAGVSECLCGSMVTYRGSSKTDWLGVEPEDVERDDAVNEAVALAMATGVLNATREANLALSITGHLGPNAPQHLDGLAFVGCAVRDGVVTARAFKLMGATRWERQHEAAAIVLETAYLALPPPHVNATS